MFTKGTTKKINFMEMDYTFGKMETFIKANLRRVKWMAEEDGGLETEMNMRESIKMD